MPVARQAYGSQWRKVRLAYLTMNPICQHCDRAASLVDHIIPHRGDARLFWNRRNWQGLCKRCHDRKTRSEN